MIQQGFNIRSLSVRVAEGQEVNLAISGNFFFAESANKRFRIETDSGNSADMSAGRKIELQTQQSNLRIINSLGSGELVASLIYGYGDVSDSAVYGEISIKNAQSVNPMAPVTLSDGEIFTIAANSTRQKLTLYADAGNTGRVWLAGEKNKGLPLYGGHAHDFTEFSGELQLCGDGSGTQTVYLMEVVE
ncbi:hypothetical protein GZ77_03515 [Endozoicomonas montiporae]|uniref:Uncharacterized protein n=2 Tax=Endozoicomonas montiporae TaxID=1027273 RepID=A0A081NB39_9GAMM|nr:hypothetical protein [Endozoicomonas montiporae]AMO56629.1 hypothetical protein EZMO1_2550 [Endozoicomonas montiporae CL-33]KEQ15662.1 hypothetical protein GZ77_03515 [Endozoicomonas montiporae]